MDSGAHPGVFSCILSRQKATSNAVSGPRRPWDPGRPDLARPIPFSAAQVPTAFPAGQHLSYACSTMKSPDDSEALPPLPQNLWVGFGRQPQAVRLESGRSRIREGTGARFFTHEFSGRHFFKRAEVLEGPDTTPHSPQHRSNERLLRCLLSPSALPWIPPQPEQHFARSIRRLEPTEQSFKSERRTPENRINDHEVTHR